MPSTSGSVMAAPPARATSSASRCARCRSSRAARPTATNRPACVDALRVVVVDPHVEEDARRRAAPGLAEQLVEQRAPMPRRRAVGITPTSAPRPRRRATRSPAQPSRRRPSASSSGDDVVAVVPVGQLLAVGRGRPGLGAEHRPLVAHQLGDVLRRHRHDLDHVTHRLCGRPARPRRAGAGTAASARSDGPLRPVPDRRRRGPARPGRGSPDRATAGRGRRRRSARRRRPQAVKPAVTTSAGSATSGPAVRSPST